MNTLTLSLTGRIDANNAPKVEAQIADTLAKNPGAVPVFDASGLEYISSAGLRILLKFRKKFGKNLDVIDVSSDVFDIFSVTGFTELLNVRKRLREISLDGCPAIGGGAFSTVYRLDPETIVKVFDKHAAALAEVERDRNISHKVFMQDIPTAIAYDVVKAGGHYGLVYEMIDADSLSGTLAEHPERLEDLSIKAARLLKQLHSTEFEPGTFPDARDKLHMMAQKIFAQTLINEQDKAVIDGVIDRIPYRNTFIHTDFHSKNLLVLNDELILIDVGDAGLGHPIIDLLISCFHFGGMPENILEKFSDIHQRIIGLDDKTLKAMWRVILREYFGTSDKDTLARYEDVMENYAAIMLLYVLSIIAKGAGIDLSGYSAQIMAHFREAADTLTPIDNI